MLELLLGLFQPLVKRRSKMANFGNYGSGKFNQILVKDLTVSDDVTITGDWAVTGTLAVTSTSTFTGAVSIDSTTATTSGITGSLHTDGGVGIAGALYVGTTTTFAGNVSGGVSGTGVDVTLYGDQVGSDFLWDMNGATNTGLLQLGTSAKGVDFIVYGTTAATYLHWDHSADDLLLVGAAAQLSVAGTTASTTSTTGSLRTAGGLGVALDAFIGGNLGLNTSASDIIIIADTAAALEVYDSTTKALAIDSRVTVTAVKNFTFTGMPATIVSAAGANWGLAALVPGTTTFSGTTQITTPIDGMALHIAQPTLTDSGALTVDQASTVFIEAEPVAADALTLTAAYALEIASGNVLTAGRIIVDDTTASTTTTTGSIQTDGGLGVAGTANFGSTVGIIGAVTISPAAAGTFLDFALETE